MSREFHEPAAPAREFHRPRLVSHARYRWDKIRLQHQIVFPEGVLVLNEAAAAIVQLCDGRPMTELVKTLTEKFYEGNVAEDAHSFLERLAQKGLLLDGDDS